MVHSVGMERTQLARLSQMSDEERRVVPVAGRLPPRRSIVLVRSQGMLKAYWNVCKHLPIPLDAGLGYLPTRSDGRLACLTHGAVFEPLSGLCIEGPCKDKSLDTVELEVEGDFIYALLPPKT